MPLPGTGIVPAAGAQLNELTALTRRAFIPKMVVQIYNSTPTMAGLFANAQTAYGGVSSVSVPVQGAPLVSGQWAGYDGSFNQPSDLQGSFLSENNLKLFVVPVPFLGMEGVLQLDHAVVPRIEAKMNDTTNVSMQLFSQAMFNNYTDTQQFMGFPAAIDDGTNAATYGNINRLQNTWWQSTVFNKVGTPNPTRQSVMADIGLLYKNCGEKPSFGVTGIGTWLLLAQDFQAIETLRMSPGQGFDGANDGPRSGFDAIMVAGVPIYADRDCPEGVVYYQNTNYLNLYVHVQGSFNFTGFYSSVPNFQLGYVGAVVVIAELVCTKPKAQARSSGYGFIS